MDTEEWFVINVCGFVGSRRGKYFERELVERIEVELRVSIENSKTTGNIEVTREMTKTGAELVID